VETFCADLLFPELIEAAERVADEKGSDGTVEIHPPKHPKRPRRRKDFPEHLPRVRTTYELQEDQLGCGCGGRLKLLVERFGYHMPYNHAPRPRRTALGQSSHSTSPGQTPAGHRSSGQSSK